MIWPHREDCSGVDPFLFKNEHGADLVVSTLVLVDNILGLADSTGFLAELLS